MLKSILKVTYKNRLEYFDMNHFLQIYFQSGDFTNEGNSFILDLIVSAIGAFIGIAGAAAIYLWQLRKERDDKLKYASSLIISIINFTARQSEHCKDLAKQIRSNPTNLSLLHIQANQDLKRMVERVDQEKFYHAFLSRYGRKDEIYGAFKFMFSSLDFIDMTLIQIQDYLEKELLSITEKKKKYLDMLDQGETKAALLTVNPAFQDRVQLMEFLNVSLTEYIPQKNAETSKDLSFPITHFIEPVIHFLTINHPTVPECNDISLFLKKAATTYSLIQQQSEGLAKSFDEYAEQLGAAGIKLAVLTTDLRRNYAIL